MAKSNKKGLLLVAALGVLSFGALALKKPGELVTGKSGKSWRVVHLGAAGSVHSYEVFTPAGSFGPHEELSVLRYSQTGSDKASRKLLGVGQGTPQAIVTAAASDFGVAL
jgi:hypothetical protein